MILVIIKKKKNLCFERMILAYVMHIYKLYTSVCN